MSSPSWRPSASITNLRLRARLLQRIRRFFADREVVEVDTPILSRYGLPTPMIESFAAQPASSPGRSEGYLHTSPEFPMKRLLAAGSGSIYQICKVFRVGERGRRHNPEFSLLEWYRIGYDSETLMAEVEALLQYVLEGIRPVAAVERLSYRGAFLTYAGVDGLCEDVDVYRDALAFHAIDVPEGMPGDAADPWRDLLLTQVIEPRLPPAVFVYDYPASQAALSRIRRGPPAVADRFELYLEGVEIANGFNELTDAAEQRRRFEAENRQREQLGLASIPVDEALLAAMDAGLPDCAGVAVGLDRLVMYAAGADNIDDVIAFPVDRA